MDVDQALLKSVDVPLDPDGILLYVRDAYYESGTSPLCVWIPSQTFNDTGGMPNPLDVFERCARRIRSRPAANMIQSHPQTCLVLNALAFGPCITCLFAMELLTAQQRCGARILGDLQLTHSTASNLGPCRLV